MNTKLRRWTLIIGGTFIVATIAGFANRILAIHSES